MTEGDSWASSMAGPTIEPSPKAARLSTAAPYHDIERSSERATPSAAGCSGTCATHVGSGAAATAQAWTKAPLAAPSLEALRPHMHTITIGTQTPAQAAALAELSADVDRRVFMTNKPGRLETALVWLDSFVAATGRQPFVPVDEFAPTACHLYNQVTFDLLASFIRKQGSRRPKKGKRAIKGDTIAGYISALKVYITRLAHGNLTSAAHNTHLREEFRSMRQEDAPSSGGDRSLSTGIRITHIINWYNSLSHAERNSSRGVMELGVAVTAHNALLRGGEVGTTDDGPLDAGRDLVIGSVEWRAPCAESRWLPWLILWVCAIKDVNARRVPAPIPIRARSANSSSDPADPYWAIHRVWQLRSALLDPSERDLPQREGRAVGTGSDAPLFVLDDGDHWETKHVRLLARKIGAASGIPPLDLRSRAFRIAGATDLRSVLGPNSARLIKERGRWSSDVAFIYQRALATHHMDASAAVGDARGRDIEGMCQGWAQPAAFR